MDECLSDRTLLLLHEGEGTSAHRAHLDACATCARRYERLERDLEMIGQVLRETPPPMAVPHRVRPLRARWMAVAAAGAVALALVWGSVIGRRPSPPAGSAPAASDEEIWQFLEEVPAVPFTIVDAPSEGVAQLSAMAALQGGPEGEWPCEQWPFTPEWLLTPGCGDPSLSLLFGGTPAEEEVL